MTVASRFVGRPSPMARLRAELKKIADPSKAVTLKRFFKTGPGDYAEGDTFIGVTVPELRKIAKKHAELDLRCLERLVRSEIHEERLLALLILVSRYKRSKGGDREALYRLYARNMRWINNWDLVDASAHHIMGDYWDGRVKDYLHKLAASKNLWERRIAIVSTLHYIRKNRFEDTHAIAKKLLDDRHDLIQKAVGWMLREVGKRDAQAHEAFLNEHHRRMPRTMLRYAIERLPEPKRKAYLKGAVA